MNSSRSSGISETKVVLLLGVFLNRKDLEDFRIYAIKVNGIATLPMRECPSDIDNEDVLRVFGEMVASDTQYCIDRVCLIKTDHVTVGQQHFICCFAALEDSEWSMPDRSPRALGKVLNWVSPACFGDGSCEDLIVYTRDPHAVNLIGQILGNPSGSFGGIRWSEFCYAPASSCQAV
jgi:hypothetical protein